MSHPWFAGGGTPRVLAHRGLVTASAARLGVVDNSFAAVAEAHAAGVLYVESDCHITADGVVVLFHDEDLARLTGDPRRVADVTVVELERLMAERGGLITLEQALDTFPSLRFNLDVKVEAAAVPVGRLVASVAERVLVTSFSDARRRIALAAAESAGGRPATSAGSMTVARVLLAAALHADRLAQRALAGIDALQIPEREGIVPVMSRRLIDTAHRHGVEVHVWTVNDALEMRRLLDAGVDGIITDHADVALAVARELG